MPTSAVNLDDLFDRDILCALGGGVAPGAAAEEYAGLDKRSAGLLSLARRIMARPTPEILIQDALGLLLDALGCDRGLVAEALPPNHRLWVRGTAPGAGAQGLSTQLQELSENSLAAQVFQSGRLRVVKNLLAETQYSDPLLRSWSVVSAVAMPLRLVRDDFGALVLGSTTPREFDPADLVCLEAASSLLMSALAHERGQQRLAKVTAWTNVLLDASDQLLVVLDSHGRMIEVNRSCLAVSGFDRRALLSRSFCEALCVPGKPELVQAALRDTRSKHISFATEAQLVTKAGTRLAVHWVVTSVEHPEATGRCLLLAGTLGQPRGSADKARASDRRHSLKPRASNSPARSAAVPHPRDSSVEPGSEANATARPPAGESRSSPRKPFPFLQRMAPYAGSEPADSDFTLTRFRDISAGGLSFVVPQRPAYKAVLVELGNAADRQRFVAEIVRVAEVIEEDEPAFLVGCRLVRRV